MAISDTTLIMMANILKDNCKNNKYCNGCCFDNGDDCLLVSKKTNFPEPDKWDVTWEMLNDEKWEE